jgi:hypothetical protein
MSPLPSDRTGASERSRRTKNPRILVCKGWPLISRPCAGTFEKPIVVKSAGDEIQVGCTGSPADSHVVRWCVVCSSENYLSCPQVSLLTCDFSYRVPDHLSVVMNAAVSTEWIMLVLQMTRMTIVMAMATVMRSQRLWQTLSSQSIGTDKDKRMRIFLTG